VNVTSEITALERGLRIDVPAGPDVFDATDEALQDRDRGD
jgi:hypothetical protein